MLQHVRAAKNLELKVEHASSKMSVNSNVRIMLKVWEESLNFP